MKPLLSLLLPAWLLIALIAHADTNDQSAAVSDFINDLKTDNGAYVDSRKIEFFAGLSKGQNPRATLVMCADSRVQTNMFERTPEGDLFIIRNIGNQLSTAEGSVEYGVRHLHTPILMFMGHSRCGAIAAASSNYSKESAAIKRELDTIVVAKGIENLDGVKININNQVTAALFKFKGEIDAGHLTVIGAVLDFADDMHKGAGKLQIININGETNLSKLENISTLLAKQKSKAASPANKVLLPASSAAESEITPH